MEGYTEEEKDRLIRDYFGPEGSREDLLCPRCGEVLIFQTANRADQFEVTVRCPDCRSEFVWRPRGSQEEWRPLHLQYFLERYLGGESIRCPFDDCYVIYSEFTGGMVEFRCPFCNRRGRIAAPTPSPDDLVDLEF